MARRKVWLSALLLVASSTVCLTASVYAATAPKTTGITISPFQQQLAIDPNGSDKVFDLTLTNNTTSLQEIRLSARDFGSLNETGGVLLEGAKEYTQKYGLVSWMSLGTDTVVLEAGESRAIPVTIQNRTTLRPGGHYGAVVASVNSLDDQKDNRVVANQQLLSLVFVNKIGGAKYDLALKTITNDGNWLHLPRNVTLRFQNPGNVHVVPRGIVRLKSPGGSVLAQGIINSESAYVLPETFRELSVPLTKQSSAPPLPGLYRIEVEYRYDGLATSVKKDANLNFVSLPTYLLLALILGTVFYVLFRRKKIARKAPSTE